MENGSSTCVENADKKLEELRAVNSFLMRAYSCCSQAEAMVMLLSNEAALKHFSNFVSGQRETGYLDLFLELRGLTTTTNPTVQYLQQHMLRIVEEYIDADSRRYIIISSTLIKNIEDLLSQGFDCVLNQPITHIIAIIDQLSQEMVELMAGAQFSHFLTSKFYQNWQANERGLASASAEAHSDATNDSKATTSQNKTSVSMVEDPALTAHVLGDNIALENILRHASWLSTFISAVEVLPMSFLLCQATKKVGDIPRFPVLYANKYAEQVLGFQRKSLIGRPYDALLRCGETEKERSAELEALTQQYQAASAVLTHANAKGVPFKNLVALKPIFDPSGACLYVIYVMFDLSARSSKSCNVTDVAATTACDDENTSTAPSSLHQDSDDTLPTEYQNDAVTDPALPQKTVWPKLVVSSPGDEFAHERAKAEKLLHILPKYLIPFVGLDAVLPPPEQAPPGCFDSALDQWRSLRMFYNRVQPTAAGVGQRTQDQQQEQKGCPQHVHGQAKVLSIRQAQLSSGPDGRLGAAPPV